MAEPVQHLTLYRSVAGARCLCADIVILCHCMLQPPAQMTRCSMDVIPRGISQQLILKTCKGGANRQLCCWVGQVQQGLVWVWGDCSSSAFLDCTQQQPAVNPLKANSDPGVCHLHPFHMSGTAGCANDFDACVYAALPCLNFAMVCADKFVQTYVNYIRDLPGESRALLLHCTSSSMRVWGSTYKIVSVCRPPSRICRQSGLA